jgi:hypothetical protein
MKFVNVFKMKTQGGSNLTRDRGALGLAARLACWAETTEAVGSGGPSHNQNGRPAGPHGTRSSAGHRALGRAVASSPAVHRWPGGGSVDAVSTSWAGLSRRARR